MVDSIAENRFGRPGSAVARPADPPGRCPRVRRMTPYPGERPEAGDPAACPGAAAPAATTVPRSESAGHRGMLSRPDPIAPEFR